MCKKLKTVTVILSAILMIFSFVKESYSFWPNLEDKKKDTKQTRHLIPLEVDKGEGDDKSKTKSIYARLKPTQEGKDAGLDKMIIEGKIVETKDKGRDKVHSIIWNKAKYDEKEVDLDTPLQSKVVADKKIKKGDEFSAKGYSGDLVKAWEELQKKRSSNASNKSESSDKDTTKKDSISSNGNNDIGYLSTNYGNSANGSGQQLPEVNPNFTPSEIITTSEGCSIRVDIDSGLAIVQEQQLKDGEVVLSCYDSAESYPLEKSYARCQDYIDYSQMKVFKQYDLSYSSPTAGGAIIVQGCTIDSENASDIIEDYAKCSFSHNYKEGYSIKQKRLIYLANNAESEFVIQDCHDSNQRYLHQETGDGCQDKIQDGVVIWSTRKYISVDGKQISISECTPKDNSIDIHEERCLEKPYTHDFTSNQSFVNKNYFYYKDNQKIILQSCTKSEEIMEHKQEIGMCNITHDDAQKVSRINHKIYIEDQGSKVFITDCISSSTPVPYVKVKTRWVKQNTQSGYFKIITPNITRIGYTDLGGNHNVSYDTSVDICYNKGLPDVWNLASGEGIDEANSDQFVQYDFRFDNYPIKYGFMYRLYCGEPHCTAITDLNKLPVYTRFDGSEFIERSQIISTMKVCGFGHLVDGREEGI